MVLSPTKNKERVESKGDTSRKKNTSLSHSEIRSGILVTTAFLALLGLLAATGTSQLLHKTYKVHILFNYISGLAKNAPVHFAGHEVGKVMAIRILGKNPGQVIVTVLIDQEAVLRQDSHAFIDLLGFMGEKFVELTPGSPASPVLKDHDAIFGTDPIALNEIMKKGTEIADELEKTTVSLRTLIGNVDETLAGNRSEIDGILKNLNQASQNVKDLSEDLKFHPWKLIRKGKEGKKDGKKRRFLFF